MYNKRLNKINEWSKKCNYDYLKLFLKLVLNQNEIKWNPPNHMSCVSKKGNY